MKTRPKAGERRWRWNEMPLPQSHKEWREFFFRAIRNNYSIGGTFHNDGRSGLCFTYEQIRELELALSDYFTSKLAERDA